MTKMHGRCIYFSKNRVEAERRFAQALLVYNASKTHTPPRRREAAPTRPKVKSSCLSVEQAIERLLKEIAPELTEEGLRYHRKNLRRFSVQFGSLPLDAVSGSLVQQFRLEQAAKYAPKTVNHSLTSLKRLLTYAKDFRWVENFDFEVKAIKLIPLEPPMVRALSLDDAIEYIFSVSKVERAHPRSDRYKRRVMLAMLLHFHLGCRPSELVRLLNNEGEWLEPWAFRLNLSKTSRRTRQYRYLVLSRESRLIYRLIHRPSACHQQRGRSPFVWETYEAYGKAVSRLTGRPPHVLRHSAATLLVQDGVSRTDVDEYLGHSISRTSLTYIPLESQLQAWLRIAQRLAGLIRPKLAAQSQSKHSI